MGIWLLMLLPARWGVESVSHASIGTVAVHKLPRTMDSSTVCSAMAGHSEDIRRVSVRHLFMSQYNVTL